MFKLPLKKEAFDEMSDYCSPSHLTCDQNKAEIKHEEKELLRDSLLNLLDSYLLFSEEQLISINNKNVISYYEYMDQSILSLYRELKYCTEYKNITIEKNIQKLIDKTEEALIHVPLFYSLNASKSIDYLAYMLKQEKNFKKQLNIK